MIMKMNNLTTDLSQLANPVINHPTLKFHNNIHLNLRVSTLIEEALKNGEGTLTDTGAFMCDTGEFTGRSPKDKFIVYDDKTAETVAWGDINQAFESDKFEALYQKMLNFISRKKLYARYVYACASEQFRTNILVVNTLAWHNLFCHHLFLRPTTEEMENFEPEWLILNVPEFEADPTIDDTRQANFTMIDFTKKIILIGGTGYAGEMKKGIFTVLNYILPEEKNVLSMHCSANIGIDGDTALFFGLSGTGKTTLSADPYRKLIGDDEHGWADDEIFNFEGGCYAKVINLSEEQEPEIFGAIKYGSILENTRFKAGTSHIDYANSSVTENTRTAYPIHYIPNVAMPSMGNSPQNIFFLTADAFGVLPPISKLTIEQAMYYFLAGYTSKLAGTEMGVKEPQATFSACFGAAFLPLYPMKYATLLGEKIKNTDVNVWLVNTGWSGGGYGLGARLKLSYTRAMIRAALTGAFEKMPFQTHEIFGLAIPAQCPDVPEAILNPRNTWENKEQYDEKAYFLAKLFEENYLKIRCS
jgi:phosphoenolpyruvate carboxykinase (ATP)